MNSKVGHIIFFSICATLICIGGFLAYSQYNADTKRMLAADNLEAENFHTESNSVIDTLKFLEDPTYEYCSLEQKSEGGALTDCVKKTVVRIRNSKDGLRSYKSKSIKEFPANASLNLQLETYAVSRHRDSCGVSYFVTLESFEAIIKDLDIPGLIPEHREFNKSSAEDISSQIDELHMEEWLRKFRPGSRPL